MKAMLLTGIGRLEMATVPDPEIRHDTDVLIRLGVVGVCGSDVHYYTTGRIGSQVVKFPFTVGHECSGVVDRVGPGVTRVKPGDRIAVEPAISCGRCDQCTVGRPHTCRNIRFLGTPPTSGCLSERLVMPEECCFPVGSGTSLELAALVEPLSVAVYSVKQSIPMLGATVGILGAGPIGLGVLQVARLGGAAAIYVTDKIDSRLAAARDAGACWTANPDKEDVAAKILEAQPLGLDVVFECCGQQDALDQGTRMLRPGGKLMVVGIPQADRISFMPDVVRRHEICIQHVRRQVHCVQPALDMVESGSLDPRFMATHRFGFEQTAEAFEMVRQYSGGVIKAMIHLAGE